MAEADKIVAVVNGHEVTEAEFEEFKQRIPEQQQEYIKTEEGRHQALAQLTNYYLFEQCGKDMKLDEREDYQHMLEGVVRELLAQYTLTHLIKDIGPTDEEAQAYYNAHPDMFNRNAQATAKHILVNTEQEALDAKADIEAGKKSFEDMARAISTCPSSAEGGSLGTFGRGQMVPEFDEAVFEGEVGKVIGPVKTQFGYHLIWIDQLMSGDRMKYNEVEKQIKLQLAQEKQNEAYMAKRVELMDKYGLEFK